MTSEINTESAAEQISQSEGESLPSGWVMTTLGEVAEVQTGRTPPTVNSQNYNGEILFIKPADLDCLDYVYNTAQTLSVLGSQFSTIIEKDTVLVSCIGNIGKLGIVACKSGFNQQINSANFKKDIVYFKFGFYALKTKKQWLEENASATTIAIINKSRFLLTQIPLPPLPEQVRIANKLDTLLASVNSAGTRLEQVPKLLKQFRQSVLSMAVSGELTREWRGGKDADWEEVKLGECLESLRNGISLKPTDNINGRPILKISSVRQFRVAIESGRFVDISDEEFSKFRIMKNDLLMTRYNGSMEFLGVAGLVRLDLLEEFTYPDKIIRLRFKSCILPNFAEISINSSAMRIGIEKIAKTTSGQTGISGNDIKSLKLPLPPLPEQAEIVRRVEKLFALADNLQQRYTQAAAAHKKLTPALLQKAFRGELVPQDPADEPASVLLQRIQAARAAAPAKAKKPKAQAAAGAKRGRKPKAQAEELSEAQAIAQLEAKKAAQEAHFEPAPKGNRMASLFEEE